VNGCLLQGHLPDAIIWAVPDHGETGATPQVGFDFEKRSKRCSI
jgi:hypothetical protein